MANILKNIINCKHHKPGFSARMSSEERRRQLIAAATSLFSQKGFSGTTTKEIAAKAEINEATIFRHFSGKDALYDAVINENINGMSVSDFCAEIEAAAERNDDEAVFSTAAKIILHRYQSERDVLRILIFGILEQRPNTAERFENEILPLRNFLTGYIKKRQAAGALFAENIELTVFGFIGMVTHHTMLGELVSEEKKVADDAEAVRLFTKIILDSLRNQ